MTGKAKTAIPEFVYCGTTYKDALKTLELTFGQPQAVTSAYFDKLNISPKKFLKMHNSESVISYSATIFALLGVFGSLDYYQGLLSASLLGQVTQKLPRFSKEAWPMHTVKKNCDPPKTFEIKDCLKNKAEAHERMKLNSGKPRTEDNNSSANVFRTKDGAKIFGSTSSSQTTSTRDKAENSKTSCIACEGKHPL